MIFIIGCSGDPVKDSINGNLDTISINVQLSQRGMKSPPDNAAPINMATLFIVDESGSVVQSSKIAGSGTINNLSVYKNRRYKIYTICNIDVNDFKSEQEIVNYTFALSSISELSYNSLVMSGTTDYLTLSDKMNINITVERVVAQLVIKCDYTSLDSDVKINIKRVELKNVAKTISLFKDCKAEKNDVINGVSLSQGNIGDLQKGVRFYLTENLQGVVAKGAANNKQKAEMIAETVKNNSSYIEMEYDYSSSRKGGTIIYRFFIGSTYEDCDIRRNHRYDCLVRFIGDGSVNESSWSVDNSGIFDITVSDPQIEFREKTKIMYEGEVAELLYTDIFPDSGKPVANSTENSVVEIIESSGRGVKVRAKRTGTASIISSVNSGKSAKCDIKVERLRILFDYSDTIFFYKGFRDDVKYKILPEHASNLPVNITSSNNNVVKHVGNNTFIGNIENQSSKITASFVDFPDKSNSITAFVKPTITTEESIDLLANADVSKSHNITHDDIYVRKLIRYDTHPRAKIQWSSNTNGLYVNSNGEVYLDDVTTLNGGRDCKGDSKRFTIRAVVVTDDNETKESNININIFEEVDIIVKIIETEESNSEGERGTSINVIPRYNKPVADVYFFAGDYFRDVDMIFLWEEGVRPLIIDYTPVNIILKRSTERNADNRYCYYISVVTEYLKY